MKNKRLIFIPTYNEAENIAILIERIQALNLGADILVIDDNSIDGTAEIIDEIANKNSNVQVIHRPGKQGIGSAHLTGISYAYNHDYKILITMDADFSHAPEDIPKFIEKEQSSEVVLGTRFEKKKQYRRLVFFA